MRSTAGLDAISRDTNYVYSSRLLQPHIAITQISLQPTRGTQDHNTWQRRTVQLIANQNAPFAIPSGTPDTQKIRKPIRKGTPTNKAAAEHAKGVAITTHLPAKFLIRRTTINLRIENLSWRTGCTTLRARRGLWRTSTC